MSEYEFLAPKTKKVVADSPKIPSEIWHFGKIILQPCLNAHLLVTLEVKNNGKVGPCNFFFGTLTRQLGRLITFFSEGVRTKTRYLELSTWSEVSISEVFRTIRCNPAEKIEET